MTHSIPARETARTEADVIQELFTGRRGTVRLHLFELATGGAYVLVGLAFLLNHRRTAVHSPLERVGAFDEIWAVLYVVGGVALLFGLLRPMMRVRAMGLIMLGTGLAMETAASVAYRLEPRVGVTLLYAVACFARAALLVRVYLRLAGAR